MMTSRNLTSPIYTLEECHFLSVNPVLQIIFMSNQVWISYFKSHCVTITKLAASKWHLCKSSGTLYMSTILQCGLTLIFNVNTTFIKRRLHKIHNFMCEETPVVLIWMLAWLPAWSKNVGCFSNYNRFLFPPHLCMYLFWKMKPVF